MNYILFDQNTRRHLYPLTLTKPVSELRVGILTIKEKWEFHLDSSASFLVPEYLSEKFSLVKGDDNILINSALLPTEELVSLIEKLKMFEGFSFDGVPLAYRCDKSFLETNGIADLDGLNLLEIELPVVMIRFPEDIFQLNGDAFSDDFLILTKGRNSLPLSQTMQVIAPENVFIEEGAKVECSIINASSGQVYIGRNAEIMEGSVIRGPFALCEGSTVKMGAKIYGPTTVGPFSKVGGEINNVVIQGYSNKGHDGFLGNSVIGEWCNIGADTNNSNLKNNYAEVRLWDYVEERFRGTGLQFCGLIMGDHSKCGINTMFNTGTVVGVFANIFGSGFPRNFIPSFAWGGAKGFKEYNKTAAFYVAKLVMERRGVEFDETEKRILEQVFDMTKMYRNF